MVHKFESGQVIDEVKILRKGPKRGSSNTWVVLCKCGKERTLRANRIASGMRSFCRCKNQPNKYPKVNTGERFCKWLVVSLLPEKNKKGQALCLALCDCGTERKVPRARLASGNSRGCGCDSNEFKHGMTDSPEYSSWRAMNSRCRSEKHSRYKHYGGRGIKVCDRWSDFNLFIRDMGPRPDGTTLDRIDVDGDYEPGNCRWATQKQQSRNRRNNRYITAYGRRLCLQSWSELTRIKRGTINRRLSYGWSEIAAISVPVKR